MEPPEVRRSHIVTLRFQPTSCNLYAGMLHGQTPPSFFDRVAKQSRLFPVCSL